MDRRREYVKNIEELFPEQPELQLIDIKQTAPSIATEPRKIAEPDRKKESRDRRWLFGALAVSLSMNMMQWVVIYILQVGPI